MKEEREEGVMCGLLKLLKKSARLPAIDFGIVLEI